MGGVDYTATASTVRTPSTDNPEQNGYTALQFNR
jgi:hypothetical protein